MLKRSAHSAIGSSEPAAACVTPRRLSANSIRALPVETLKESLAESIVYKHAEMPEPIERHQIEDLIAFLKTLE